MYSLHAEYADLAKAEKSLAALVRSQASVKGFVQESMKLAGAKHVLQSETGRTEGQTYLLFQESSSVVQRLRHISQDPFEVHWPAALMG